MADHDQRLLEKLLPIFREEAREHVTLISSRLADLESASADALDTVLEEIFREAHSLKAAARAVGRRDIEFTCQAVESVFSGLRREAKAPTPAVLTALHRAADALADFLASTEMQPGAQNVARAQALADALEAAVKGANAPTAAPTVAPPAPARPRPEPVVTRPAQRPEPPVPAPSKAPPPAPPVPLPSVVAEAVPAPAAAIPSVQTVRLSIARLDVLLVQAEEMLLEKLASERLTREIRSVMAGLSEWKREIASAETTSARLRLRGEGGRVGEPASDVFELSVRRVRELETRLAAIAKLAAADARSLGSKVDRLLQDMKRTLTLPCSSVLRLLPRVVRELSEDQGKDITLTIVGGELEMDRRILDELKDPILHIVRNAVDHGIEAPAERVAHGKPARGAITVTVASGDGDKVAFTIADDGGGIAVDRLRAAAQELGLASPERSAESDLLHLVFQSGLSTRTTVTEVSGRGLGLAIVQEKLERLGGSVSVESQPGRGTTFRLVVPLTLATYRGIVVKCSGRRLVLPTLGVERVIGVARQAVRTIENRAVIDVGDTPVPLVSLGEVLELPPGRDRADGRRNLLLVGTLTGRVAFEVDEIEGDQEVLMKPLGQYLARVRNVQGATVLPTGEIVPILNVHDLLKSAMRRLRGPRGQTASLPAKTHTAEKTILIVEDSVTARMLLRNILDAAGYRVRTAVDGLDAWTSLSLDPPDLVVSDVEMPRMNGFELTQRIRRDKRLADLPVILVTALESQEHRERGVEAGADAYITKGGFDQERLLDAIRRLA